MSVPALVGTLPEWWQRILLPCLSASTLHSLSGAASPEVLEYLAPRPWSNLNSRASRVIAMAITASLK